MLLTAIPAGAAVELNTSLKVQAKWLVALYSPGNPFVQAALQLFLCVLNLGACRVLNGGDVARSKSYKFPKSLDGLQVDHQYSTTTKPLKVTLDGKKYIMKRGGGHGVLNDEHVVQVGY